MRQTLESMRADLAAMRKSQQPNGNGGGLTRWLPTINVVLAAMLTIGAGLTAYSWKEAGERDRVINKAVNDIERLDKYNSVLEVWKSGVETDRQRFRLVDDATTRNSADIKNFGEKLEAGRTVRERDIKSLEEGQNRVALELSGLKVEISFMRRTREDRENGNRPFGERQMWIVPPSNPIPTPQILKTATREKASPAIAVRTKPRRRAVRRKPVSFLVALFGPASKVRRSAFGTPMRR